MKYKGEFLVVLLASYLLAPYTYWPNRVINIHLHTLLFLNLHVISLPSSSMP